MGKRVTGIYCLIVLLMTTAIFRIYYINASDYLTAASSSQGSYGLEVANFRGAIYDRSFNLLVNNSDRYVAAVLPTPQSAAALLEVVPEEERAPLMERLSGTIPFAMAVNTNNIYAEGIDVFRVPVRYDDWQIAPHIIGYLSGDDKIGVAGIEKAYDSFLTDQGGKISASYQVDAAGRALQGGGITIRRKNESNTAGVVLTLDQEMQRIVQDSLSAGCEKGAAVVLDIATGDILAMVSLPAFDQNNIAASLDSEDAPFINRAISGYNIGSVFKLVVTAAALENNISPDYQYECEGYIDVDGQVFRCNNHAIHGVVDMERALQVSCNTYFINLAQQIEPQSILTLCEIMGLGSSAELAPELFTQPGNLPGTAELSSSGAYANFSFGQGSSLATPLQMAQAVATIANGGMAVTPRLVLGTTLDGQSYDERTPSYVANQILSDRTSVALQALMVSVVEEGSGKPAHPVQGGAGGKTSSAQTGQMDEEEKEIVHAWFVGFYPDEQPRYSIVVFCEGGESGEQVAAPIFKQIADGISTLNS